MYLNSYPNKNVVGGLKGPIAGTSATHDFYLITFRSVRVLYITYAEYYIKLFFYL